MDILDKNHQFDIPEGVLKEEFNIFSEMNFFEENTDIICNSGMKYLNSENIEEVAIIPKKLEKKGFFERLFHIFK